MQKTKNISVGSTVPCTLMTSDQFGVPFSGLTVVWTVDNSSIVTVDSSGNITGVAAGTTTVTATLSNTHVETILINVYTPVATKYSLS